MRLEDNFITYYIVQSLVTIIIAQFSNNNGKSSKPYFLVLPQLYFCHARRARKNIVDGVQDLNTKK